MKRNEIVLSIIFAISLAIPKTALSQQQFIYKDGIKEYYLLGKIKNTSDGKDFWVQEKSGKGKEAEFRKKRIALTLKYKGDVKGYDKYSFTNTHFVINCYSEKMMLIRTIDYDINGEVLNSDYLNSEVDIVPNTTGEEMFQYACSPKKKLIEITDEGEILTEPKNKFSPLGKIGAYKNVSPYQCEVKNGEVIIAGNGTENAFVFEISVSNGLYSGHLEGMATFTSETTAVYSETACIIYFTFENNSNIKITQTHCQYYHGANICFEGEYIKKN